MAEREPISAAMGDIENARAQAQGAADVLRGIPVFMSTQSAFQNIADKLTRAKDLLAAVEDPA